MAEKRKLQVFISSTYSDLKEERQAAVEAVLTAGHIPAGMELFAAGDESQLAVIQRWIDESDVYLLILGGRYGSVDAKSQKSYIQLEYEYAVERGKPSFAVVIQEDYLEEKVKKFGSKVIETQYPQQLREFRSTVLSKIVRFWRDPRDIKLAILETIADFNRRSEVVGWIPATEAVNAGPLAEEIARLTKENDSLRRQVANLSPTSTTYNGLTFEEMYRLLLARVDDSGFEFKKREDIREVARIFEDPEPALVHVFWMMSEAFRLGEKIRLVDLDFVSKLEGFALIERVEGSCFRLTMTGKQFLMRLMIERASEEAQQYILPVTDDDPI